MVHESGYGQLGAGTRGGSRLSKEEQERRRLAKIEADKKKAILEEEKRDIEKKKREEQFGRTYHISGVGGGREVTKDEFSILRQPGGHKVKDILEERKERAREAGLLPPEEEGDGEFIPTPLKEPEPTEAIPPEAIPPEEEREIERDIFGQATPEERARLLEERRARGTEFELFKEQLPTTAGEFGKDILEASALAGVPGSIPAVKGAVGGVTNFLAKAFRGGKVKKDPTAILKAPTEAAKINGTLKGFLGFGLAAVGLGSGSGFVRTLLTAKSQKLETEIGKLGEQLTKVPESAKLGFALDDDGQLYEYTSRLALSELGEITETLDALELRLQEESIGNILLKITGKHATTQREIDKQRREIEVAEGKVLLQVAAPTDQFLEAQEFWRSLDFIE